jgi:uncharacterized protein (TIGR02145 family)
MKSIISLAATLALAITFTLTACDEKKKQDGTTTTATEPAAATQAAVAEKPAENADGGTFTDTRDKKTYKTAKVGTQTWMAENLNYEAKGSKCYANKPDNCQKYGRLYDWETAKSACPSGWHLPSDEEWRTIINFAGGKDIAGKKLKAKSGWGGNANGTDDYGFSALPSGFGFSDSDSFYDIGEGGLWFSSSEYGSYAANGDNHDNNMSFAAVEYAEEYNGEDRLHSVRCIKN